MATQTPKRDDIHGEEIPKPRFGGSAPGGENTNGVYDEPGHANDSTGNSPETGGSSNSVNTPYSPNNSGQPRKFSSISFTVPSPKKSPGSESVDRRELEKQEGAAESGSSSAADAAEQSFADRLKGAENKYQAGKGSGKAGKLGNITSLRGYLSRFTRKRVALVAIVGLIGGGGAYTGTIVQGPAEAMQLSQILQNASDGQEDTNSIRLHGVYRYYKTGNIGETRLSFLESKLNARITTNLAKSGVRIVPDPTTGQVTRIELDTSTKTKYTGLSDRAARAAIANDHGVPVDKVERIGFGTKGAGTNRYAISADSKVSSKRGAIRFALNSQNTGKINTAMQMRILTKYFNAPSLYHVFKRTEARATQATVDAKRARDAEREKKAQATERSASAIEKAKEVRSKLDGTKGLHITGAALSVQATMCIARDVADSVADINRGSIVIPAVKAGVYGEAAGDQPRSGDDLTIRQVGNYTKGLRDDNGKSVWLAAPLRALYGKSGGEDIPNAHKQAFATDSNARKIKSTIDDLGGGVMCSWPAQAAGTVVGVGLVVTGTGGAVLKTAQIAGGAVLMAGITELLPKILTDEPPIGHVLEGPLGGAIAAYGVKEKANIIGRASGAVARDGTTTRVVQMEIDEAKKQEFQSKNLWARIFDKNDYRSAVATLAREQSGTPSQNLANLFNFKQQLSSFSSALSPKAAAATNSYDWGFPDFDFTPAELENDKVQNPYENGAYVAGLFKSDKGPDYITRVKKCFGVKIENTTEGWDAIPEEDVNPASDEYHSGNCGDKDEDWLRIRLFIKDTRLMETLACEELEDAKDSCEKIGAEGVAAASGDDANSSGSTADAELKKTITVSSAGKFIKMPSKYSCEGRVTEIDSRIAASLAYLLTKYDMCADDGLASGHKSHGAGLGVDIKPRKNVGSKEEWEKTVEAAARDMGWWGDGAKDSKSNDGCAFYAGYGQCVGGNGEIPKWVRWIGYNGDVDHGDPWHIFGGSYAHIHIGWDTPNGDGASPVKISKPVSEVYTFPAPVPDDLKDLVGN